MVVVTVFPVFPVGGSFGRPDTLIWRGMGVAYEVTNIFCTICEPRCHMGTTALSVDNM